MNFDELKRPGDAPDILDAALNQALAELSTVSHVRASRVNADTSHMKPGSSPPSGDAKEMCQILRSRYRKCDNNFDRLQVIKEAQTLLREIRYAPDRAYVRGTREWKLAVARDQRISVEVACVYGVSSSYVRQLRADLREGKLDRKDRVTSLGKRLPT